MARKNKECSTCLESSIPTTYATEGCSEPICWKCLAQQNWALVGELRDLVDTNLNAELVKQIEQQQAMIKRLQEGA